MKLVLATLGAFAAISSFSCSPEYTATAMPLATLLHKPPHPTKKSETVKIADDNCEATIEHNINDETKTKINPAVGSLCQGGDFDTPQKQQRVFASGIKLLDISGSITVQYDPSTADVAVRDFGTMTCYGPPIPSPPRCICTKPPCP